jgi:hypothetical protein
LLPKKADLRVAMMKNLAVPTDESDSQTWQIPHLPQVKMPHFGLHVSQDEERVALENYIHTRFSLVHGAQVTHFLPNIISLSCNNSYSAAVGLAPARQCQLFAERYLGEPAQHAIARQLGQAVERERILEIGNLVSSWKGSSLLLFIFLSELIERLGYHWALFTATREVESLLARMHYKPIVLADASPTCLPDGGASWGSYYNHQPRVMFGDVRNAVNIARKSPMYRATVTLIGPQIDDVCARYRELSQLNDSSVTTPKAGAVL